MAKASTRRGRRTASVPAKVRMVFARQNYILLLIGIALIVFGYAIMRLENDIDGIISLYLAPLLILGGYLEIIFAIMWRPKEIAGAGTSTPEPGTAAG